MTKNREKRNMKNINKGMIGMSRIVKTLVLIVMLGSVCVGAFGRGIKEAKGQDGKIYKASTTFKLSIDNQTSEKFPYVLNEHFGSAIANITLPSQNKIFPSLNLNNILFGFCKIGNRYFNIADGEELREGEATYFFDQINSAGEYKDYIIESDDFIIAPMADKFLVDTSIVYNPTNNLKEITINQILIPILFNTEQSVEVLFMNGIRRRQNDGKTVYDYKGLTYFRFNINLSFFDGENIILELFKDTELTQLQKKFLVMMYFLNKDYLSEVEQTSASTFSDFADTELCSDLMKTFDPAFNLNDTVSYYENNKANIISQLKDSQSLLKRGLGTVLRQHFKLNFEEREYNIDYRIMAPYLNLESDLDRLNNKSFDSLYGLERDPYITLFLGYLFYINKPISTEILAKALDDLKLNSLDYNFASYQKLDAIDGSELAEMALRYLTWGVEYSLDPKNSGIINTSVIPVLNNKANYDSLHNIWLNSENTNRNLNYFDSNILNISNLFNSNNNINISIPKQMQVLNSNFNSSILDLIGFVKNDFSFYHIDAWTSEKLSNPDLINNITLQSGEEIINANKLIDNDITDATSINKGGKDIRLNLGFTSEQKIKGLGLYRATRPFSDSVNTTNDYVRFEYKSENKQYNFANFVNITEINKQINGSQKENDKTLRKIYDYSDTTRWVQRINKNGDDLKINVKFDKEYKVNKIRILWETAYADEYSILQSDGTEIIKNDEVNYVTQGNLIGNKKEDIVEFKDRAFKTNELSLLLKKNYFNRYYSIWSLEIFTDEIPLNSSSKPKKIDRTDIDKYDEKVLFIIDNSISTGWSDFWRDINKQFSFNIGFDNQFVENIELYWGEYYANEYELVIGDKKINVDIDNIQPEYINIGEYNAAEKMRVDKIDLSNFGYYAPVIQLTLKENNGIPKNFSELVDANGNLIDYYGYTLNEMKIESNGFIEYVSDMEKMKFIKYDGINRKAGYGFYNDSKQISNTVAHYFLFPDSFSCSKLTMIDETGYTNLNLNEIMFFENNPVDYQKDPLGNLIFQNIIQIDKNNVDDSGSGINPSSTLINTNPINLVSLTQLDDVDGNKIGKIRINLGAGAGKIKQIIFYEGDSITQNSNNFLSTLRPISSQLRTGPYFYYNLLNQPSNVLEKLDGIKYTTPFTTFPDNSFYPPVITELAGNAIPYSPMGIDSPRTFNYKMYKQYEARTWVWDKLYISNLPASVDSIANNRLRNLYTNPHQTITTAALNSFNEEDFSKSYVTEELLLKEIGQNVTKPTENGLLNDDIYAGLSNTSFGGNVIKPFIPSRFYPTYIPEIDKSNNLYQYDKVPGVDSLGLLAGSLSMMNKNSEETTGTFTTNIFGIDIGDELDKYYSMNSPAAGLDSEFEPAYYTFSEETKSYLEGNYRLARSDIEKMSVMLPDLRQIRAGDILCNYIDNENEPHIGIVVATLWEESPPQTTDEIMKNTVVISISRGLQKTTLGIWGNGGNTFGGFAFNPKNYHVRRLLKKTKAENGINKSTDSLFDIYLKELVCDVELPVDEYLRQNGEEGNSRWIPNTDEYLGGLKIKLYATDEDNRNIDLESYGYEIKLLSPVDRNFDIADINVADNSNNNKGAGIIFGAKIGPEENPYVWLAKATREETKISDFISNNQNLNNGSVDSELIKVALKSDNSFYKIEYNPEYFPENDGKGVGCRLYVKAEGELWFESDDGTFGTNEFGVKAIDRCRPGDDFLLSFGIVGDDVKGIANPGSFVAVYDKKMLWRAELYVDETEALLGDQQIPRNADWNNINLWNDPGNNDWVFSETDFVTGDDFYNEYNYTPGGQIKIRSWTSYNSNIFFREGINPANNGVVAYNSGTTPSVLKFNEQMFKQKTALQSDVSTAPDGNWYNYLGVNIKLDKLPDSLTAPQYDLIKERLKEHIKERNDKFQFNLDNFTNGYDSVAPHNLKNNLSAAQKAELLRMLNSTSYWKESFVYQGEPYRPQYNAIMFYDQDIFGRYFYASYHKDFSISSGTDCSGLIFLASEYSGTPYTLALGNDPAYDQSFNTGRATHSRNVDWVKDTCWIYWTKNQSDLKKLVDNNDYVQKTIIPGDIVIIKGHTMMVRSIQYDEFARAPLDKIIFIESASGISRQYRVLVEQTLEQYINQGNSYPLYEFGRLKE